MDATAALAAALLLRAGDCYAIDLLRELAVDGWALVNVPSIEQAAEAIRHQKWDAQSRTREERDADAVLALLRGAT